MAAVLVICACLYTLLPFANIIAYGAFGGLGGAVTGGSSFVYADYIGAIHGMLNAVRALFDLPETFADAPDRWLRWISAISALLGLVLKTYATRRRMQQSLWTRLAFSREKHPCIVRESAA
jgi:hypothetical protein